MLGKLNLSKLSLLYWDERSLINDSIFIKELVHVYGLFMGIL